MQGWQQCVPVSVLVMEAVLIAKDTGVLLVCNLLQSQDMSIQTDASKSRVVSHWGQRGCYPGGKLRVY